MELYSEEDKIQIEVFNILKKVIDPELGINIVDMGLIYQIKYSAKKGIQISMTLSSKGCPMGDVIMEDIKNTLNTYFSDKKHIVELTWEPKWTSDFVTPEGRKALNSY